MEDRLPRRLAAILYADVVGYSRLTGEDEDATHRALSEYLDIISSAIESHGGQVVHYAGDAVLAKFAAVVDAMLAAVYIQNDLKTRNKGVPDERKVQFRMGLNLSDVIEDRGNIYGDGVNIAARLESLADPGGICISDAVRSAVRKKIDLDYEDMGEQVVKNIVDPVQVYRVKLDTLSTTNLASESTPAVKQTGTKDLINHKRQNEDPPIRTRPPVVAVLPLKNLSGLQKWEYFADGISEDIITDLTRFADIGVIARNSSFTYKNKSTDIRTIGIELKADYVLEGSIQVRDAQVRITIQLINARDSTHVWAERYERDCEDLFVIQDDIVERVCTAIGGFDGAILRIERTKIGRRPPSSLQAYELYLLGYELEEQLTQESNKKSIEVLEHAIEMDPNYARLWTVLGWACYFAVEYAWTDTPTALKAREKECIREAARLDPRDPMALKDLGILLAQEGDIENAKQTFESALYLGRNFSDVLVALAQYFVIVMGNEEKGKQLIEDGLRLNPIAPTWCYMNLVRVCYFTRDFEGALSAAKNSAGDFPQTQLFTLLSLAQLGRAKDTQKHRQGLDREFPAFDFKKLIRELPLVHKPSIELYLDGLKKAELI